LLYTSKFPFSSNFKGLIVFAIGIGNPPEADKGGNPLLPPPKPGLRGQGLGKKKVGTDLWVCPLVPL